MTLPEIRKAYDQNYHKMIEVIREMGGDNKIKFHREKRTILYRNLKELQLNEHRLSDMESQLLENESAVKKVS
ncbi:MAG: hypothetical protein ACW99F_16920 [Candidatus Hodarchaeales archaeon]|jgi:hypothetical protein